MNTSTETRYYWISWYQPTDDHRPLSFPPHDPILGWWRSGRRLIDGQASLVAMVAAEDEAHAKAIIQRDWPEVVEWRFVEQRVELDVGDRFPLGDWMVPRFERHRTLLSGGRTDVRH